METEALFSLGYCLREFPVPAHFEILVRQERWDELDSEFKKLLEPKGAFFEFLNRYHDFSSIEFIISIRDSQNEWEEDGIWHDDGSRVFAFSLSLTLPGHLQAGGHLEIRKKGFEESLEKLASIPTPPWGTVILFLTGIHGFEHRTRQVESGTRLVLAGWCS